MEDFDFSLEEDSLEDQFVFALAKDDCTGAAGNTWKCMFDGMLYDWAPLNLTDPCDSLTCVTGNCESAQPVGPCDAEHQDDEESTLCVCV